MKPLVKMAVIRPHWGRHWEQAFGEALKAGVY